MSVALITVFLLNAVALFAFPAIGAWVGMNPHDFGLWAAMAIHDTSSVAGAAARYGPAALAVAVPVKLARALWIMPLAAGAAVFQRKAGGTYVPWFVLGFLAASAAATFLPAVAGIAPLLVATAKAGLAATLFLIGTALSREALRDVGVRPFIHAIVLWLIVSVVSFAAVRSMSARTEDAGVQVADSRNADDAKPSAPKPHISQ
jgi:uncharacterized membrane protein YadS